MRGQNQKKRESLRWKMTRPIMLTVLVFFLVMSIGILKYYSYNYTEQIIDSQRSQLQSATTQVAFLQSTMSNIAKQVATDTELQRDITMPIEVSAEYSLTKRKVTTSLATYSHIVDGIKEIVICTVDGKSFSSISVRDEFNPESNAWYLNYKQTGKIRGYTETHMSTPIQTDFAQRVISYVLTYYSADAAHREIGDLILSLNLREIEVLTALDTTYLDGYALYDGAGNVITQSEDVTYDYGKIQQQEDNAIIEEEDGNYLLISKGMEDDWCMVSEVSGNALRNQVRVMEIYLCILFLGMALVVFFLLNSFIRRIVQPINELSVAAEKVGDGNFDVAVSIHTNDELEMLAEVFNKMVVDIQQYMDESIEHAKRIRKMQVDQLILQINPHFIYNTLNSIVYMAHIHGDKDIADFANAFISLLQSTLKLRNSIYITLEEELQNVSYYLQLQMYRYGGKFRVDIQCPEELKDCAIPNVVLQPVVENAIFHGLAPKEETGTMSICANRSGDKVTIIVQDDGVGMTEEALEQIMTGQEENRSGLRKIGVANVKTRIEEIYGEPYGFTIQSKENRGTTVVICIPYQKCEDSEEKS